MIKILFDGSSWVVFRDDDQFVRLNDVESVVEQYSTQANFATQYLRDLQDRARTVLTPEERKELYDKLTILYLIVRDGFV